MKKKTNLSNSEYSDEETASRMNDAVRRALNTPPKRLKEVVGKSERAELLRERRIKRALQSKPKSP